MCINFCITYCYYKNTELSQKVESHFLSLIPPVSGPVSNLSYQIMSDTSAKIMWSEPEEPNGNITRYDVTFGDYGDYRGHTMESVTSTMKELMDLCK